MHGNQVIRSVMVKKSTFRISLLIIVTVLILFPGKAFSQTDQLRQSQKIPYIHYSCDKSKLVLAIDHHSGWEYKMLKFKFPNRLVLEISFKDGIPADFQSAEPLPIFESLDVPMTYVLMDANSSMDSDGIQLTISSNYPLKFEESFDEQSNQLIITIPLVFTYEAKHEIRPGVEYWDIFTADEIGPRKLHLVFADLTSNRFIPTILTAADFGNKLLSVKSMTDKSAAVCAVNGGFYSSSGDHQGLIIRGGRLESYPNFDRPVFVLTKDHKIHIGKLPFKGTLIGPDNVTIDFDGLDRRPKGDEVILLTPQHPVRLSNSLPGGKIVIKDYKIEMITSEDVPDKKGRYIIWSPYFKEEFNAFHEGDDVNLEFMLGTSNFDVECALGAGPMLITDGEVNVDLDGEFQRDIVRGRAPRTGIGMDKDGHLILAVLEGRNPYGSIGGTLSEFAELLKRYGAVLAMNLDGGSSSALVIDGEKKSFNPGDSKGVSNALAIIDSRPLNENGTIY